MKYVMKIPVTNAVTFSSLLLAPS